MVSDPWSGRSHDTACSNAQRLTRAWVWAGALSLAATRAISVDFFSSGYLDVSVPRVVSSRPISFRRGCPGMTLGGFPHSEICGSKAVCASPQLIAACRVLLRLPVPRHPPCALNIFFASGPEGPRRLGWIFLKIVLRDRRCESQTCVFDSLILLIRCYAMQLSRCPAPPCGEGRSRRREPSEPDAASRGGRPL